MHMGKCDKADYFVPCLLKANWEINVLNNHEYKMHTHDTAVSILQMNMQIYSVQVSNNASMMHSKSPMVIQHCYKKRTTIKELIHCTVCIWLMYQKNQWRVMYLRTIVILSSECNATVSEGCSMNINVFHVTVRWNLTLGPMWELNKWQKLSCQQKICQLKPNWCMDSSPHCHHGPSSCADAAPLCLSLMQRCARNMGTGSETHMFSCVFWGLLHCQMTCDKPHTQTPEW